MKYLQGTEGLPLTFSSDGSGMLAWWVDAPYAVHPDMKGHTGGVFTMGRGAVSRTFIRQQLGTRSSTESELVGIHDALPDILWTKDILEPQGYLVIENVLHQVNQSCKFYWQRTAHSRAGSGRSISTCGTSSSRIRSILVMA
jgi:hypothetical protein